MAFYALDLRKSGRARRPGQTAHYVSDLALYDDELERALAIVADAHPGLPVVLAAHSTGGLIVPLWLDRRRAAGRVAPVAGLVLNSPWFDLQGKPVAARPGDAGAAGAVQGAADAPDQGRCRGCTGGRCTSAAPASGTSTWR